jgi:hypothetical protein
VTLNEAAESLGLAPATLRRQLATGKLKGRKVGPVWTLTPAEVERYRSASLGRRLLGRPRKGGQTVDAATLQTHAPEA